MENYAAAGCSVFPVARRAGSVPAIDGYAVVVDHVDGLAVRFHFEVVSANIKQLSGERGSDSLFTANRNDLVYYSE